MSDTGYNRVVGAGWYVYLITFIYVHVRIAITIVSSAGSKPIFRLCVRAEDPAEEIGCREEFPGVSYVLAVIGLLKRGPRPVLPRSSSSSSSLGLTLK